MGLRDELFERGLRKHQESLRSEALQGQQSQKKSTGRLVDRPRTYMLEITMRCKNCGARKETWCFVSDGTNSADFIVNPCENCGTIRVSSTIYCRMHDMDDRKNNRIKGKESAIEVRADAASENLVPRSEKLVGRGRGENTD